MKKLMILGLLFMWYFQAPSQSNNYDVLPSSGNYCTSDDFTLSWTLGECITETFHTNEIILTQGFQQGMFLITSLDEHKIEGLLVKVYPNPFTDLINIFATYNSMPHNSFRIELFDAQGKVLLINKFSSNSMQIDMSEYSGGVFLLKVVNSKNKIYRNFKILKIN
jgi:hypothetical protein